MMALEHNKVSETERWVIKDEASGKIVSSAYVYKYENKTWEISRLKTVMKYRGRRYASRIIWAIIDRYGDRELKINACPMFDKPMTKGLLLSFYRKFGFIHKEGTEGIMIRTI